MPLIRTEKQKESLSKFLYDVAKIVLASAVIAPVVNLSVFSYMTMIGGLLTEMLFFCLAYILDGKELRL
ncbi:MAG: DUF6722 family protein [Nitrospiraceae bacterium]